MKPAKFKMTELGPIPEDWEVKQLGEIGEPLMCKRILKSQTLDAGDVPFYKIGTFGGTADAYISRSLYESYRRKYSYPQKGDVLLSAAGTIGRTVVYDGRDAYFQDSNIVWLDNDESQVLNEYLYWWYKVISWNTEDGGIVTRLYNNNLKSSLIALPPLPEQRRIAVALSDVDELISALGKLIEKKRNIKTGTMQQLLTGKRRLPGFGGAEFKQTELSPIPEDWEVRRLGEVFSMLRNNTYARDALTDDGGKVFNVHYGDILVKYGARVKFEMDEVPCLKAGIKPNKDMLQDGDLIFADTAEDEMVGKAVEVSGLKGRQAVAGLHTVLCRPNADTFALGFLGYFINSAIYHNQLLPLITGTKVSSVSRAGFASTYVCIPPLPEQRAIAAVLSDMDAEIAALEAEQAKYARIKSGMMQELLTGKTRLR